MKRGLVFSLCAVALAGLASMASAQNVQLSLNLRYTNPANPANGGTWYLMAKTDDPDGIAGISAYINNIDITPMGYGNTGGIDTRYGGAAGTINATTLSAILNSGQPYKTTIGGAINVVYGQDTANGPIVADVGQGVGTPGNVAVDPLRNTAWNNAALIANGTFGATRPTIATNVGTAMNNTDANTLAGTALNVSSQDAATTIVIRGDAERSLPVEGAGKGLWAGDANRDGTVNAADLALLLANYDGTGKTWDQGNFNNTAGGANTVVNAADLALLLANYDKVGVPVSTVAIPEPHSLALAASGLVMALIGRRKRS